VPIHPGGEAHGVLGNQLGAEPVALTIETLPNHNHGLVTTSDAATTGNPKGVILGDVSPNTFYGDAKPTSVLGPSVMPSGSPHASHTNMMPFVALNYIISLFGIDPEQS
jgi:microcystin-dependent protein